jgi:hypothetical protein
VRGAYHSKTDLISNECMGDWMIPNIEKVFSTAMKAQVDPLSITIDEAYDTASGVIDIAFKNRDSCQFTKVYDDYKNWCINNMDMCIGADDLYLERIYDQGYELFAAFYDLVGIYMFQAAPCVTDAEFLIINNKVVEDVTSITSVIIGFEADYTVTAPHISNKSYQEQV